MLNFADDPDPPKFLRYTPKEIREMKAAWFMLGAAAGCAVLILSLLWAFSNTAIELGLH